MDESTQQPSQAPTPPPPPPPPPAVPPVRAPQPPPRRGMSAGAKWAIGCGIFVVLAFIAVCVLAIAGMVSALGGGAEYGAGVSGANVALIRVEGAITAGGAGGGPFAAGASAERIVAQLQNAAEDRAIKAILLRINSPGGSAAGSQEMYAEIRRIRKDVGKPIYTSMGDVAASGGYYVASATERIFADPGTMTGSIGVISANLDLSGLFNKIGIQPQVMKEGKFKDMGSGLRAINPEERQIFQQLLNTVYKQFVADVAAGRNLPEKAVLKIADGRIYTGEQAQKIKLVDELGGMRPALRALAKRAGITGKPKMVEYRKKSLMDILLGEVRAPIPQGTTFRGLLYDRAADLLTRGALDTEAQP